MAWRARVWFLCLGSWCDYYKLINKHIAVINLLIMKRTLYNPGTTHTGPTNDFALHRLIGTMMMAALGPR